MEKYDKIDLELLKNEMTRPKRLESLCDINFAYIANELNHIPELYEVIYRKVDMARKNDIEFHLLLPAKIELKKLNETDLSYVTKILLDNAFEAAIESEQKFIEMTIARAKKLYWISILNSCMNVVDIGDVFTFGYTTKKNHSGRGLNDILETIRKYPQGRIPDTSLEIEYMDNFFFAVLCFK